LFTELQAGQLMDQRFKIKRAIDRGGMSEIYEAVDQQTRGRVALKVPLRQFEGDEEFLSRFQREEQIGLELHHPYILKFLATAKEKTRPYIVTEYVEGETLAMRLLREGQLPETEATRIVTQLCEAIAYMHLYGVIHRDLKPDNIMLCRDGTIRIIDFGIAKSANCRRLTFGDLMGKMGTVGYISPEQIQGHRGDVRSDIYAVGAIFYEMITGVVPYNDKDPLAALNARLVRDPEAPRERNPEVSPQIEAIILRALQRDPARRYNSASEMKLELEVPQGTIANSPAF